MTVQINSFVRRQTKESRFSYYDGTFEELASLVSTHLDPDNQKGFRDGVLEVPVPPEKFFSSVVELKEGDKLVGSFEARRNGEEPRKSVEALGARKSPAKFVKVILFSSQVLAENGDNELPAEPDNWEVISINASTCEDGNEPINPEVLIANHFGLDGGTNTKMTPEEFENALRVSVEYWKNKAMCAGS